MNMQPDKHKTSLNLDAVLVKRLKIKAITEGLSVTEALEEAIRQYVKGVEVPRSKR